VTLSDGTNSVTKEIAVTINDIDGPLTCSSGETVTLLENTEGQFYIFEATKPDSIPADIFFEPRINITRSGSSPVSEDFTFSISAGPPSTYNVAQRILSAFHFINAEGQGNLDDIFTISTEAKLDEEVAICAVNVKIGDVMNEVTSGIKFSGSYPDDYGMRTSEVGDLDGDGLSELWITTRKSIPETPWEHQGYVVFGKTINGELSSDGKEEILVNSLDASQAVKVFGTFPPVREGRFIGNNLVSSPIDDIDGDGVPELLLALQTPGIARESAFADRPLAYVIWGNALTSQVDGEIDLNTLLPSEGLILEGLGGIDRKGNTAIGGDFDGDGISDVAIGIPLGEIAATATSRYRGQIFIAFGSYLRSVKSIGKVDLLDDLADLDPSEVLLLTAEDEDDNISQPPELPLLSGSGRHMFSLKDIDGDGADELVTNGVNAEQFVNNLGVISSMALIAAKGATGFLEYEDISDTQIDIIKFRGDPALGVNNGDIDQDGLSDLLFVKRDNFDETSLGAIVKGSVLQNNNSVMPIDIEIQNPNSGIIVFDSPSESTSVFSISFFGDLDGDDRDDILISYLPLIGTEGNATISIVLAKSLDTLSNGGVFRLDQMEAGDGLHILNASIRNLGSEFSGLRDIDRDNIPDLSVTANGGATLGKESYLIPGSALRTALQSGSLVFDLEPRFRGNDP